MEVGVKTNESNVFVEILTDDFKPVASACLSVTETDTLIAQLQNAKSSAQCVEDFNRRVSTFKKLTSKQQIEALEAVKQEVEYPE